MSFKSSIHHAKKDNIVITAIKQVEGFSAFYSKLEKHISISGKSESTLYNYSRYLAKIALHFGCVPTLIEPEKINEYLYFLQQNYQSISDSYFKFTVFGLRFAYKIEGLPEKYIALPKIKKVKKLPVVLSKEEVKRLIATPKLLKHSVLIGLLYGCGLRCFETRNIKLSDLDFDRRMLHVRQGKGKKDRYVPLSLVLIDWLKKYIESELPNTWLFNGKPLGRSGGDFDNRYSQRGIQSVVKNASKKANIIKEVSVHTLRHTFATHLLEDGLDIVSIKDLLGHSRIETTLIYLHVAQYDKVKLFSPLDTLYANKPLKFEDTIGSGSDVCSLAEHFRNCKDCKQVGLVDVLG